MVQFNYKQTNETKFGNLHKIFCEINEHKYLISNWGRKKYYDICHINSYGELWFEVCGKSIDECLDLMKKKLKVA